MPWVRFARDFNWHVPGLNGRATIRYRAGAVRLVTTACAEAAVRRGAAARTVKPRAGGTATVGVAEREGHGDQVG